MSENYDIAVIGLAVMGQNLILNMDDHGHRVVAYNRTYARTEKFLEGPAKGTQILGVKSLEDLVTSLSVPRKIMLMVKAGDPVDATIDSLIPMLQPGDVIIDGGNSNYTDSQRRAEKLGEHQLLFVGSGVSGGEEGARHGPSMMPGGHKEAWPLIKTIFQSIAAKTDAGIPCCDWVGDGGAGHFVKMVHNGIEYGDMQLICESYQFMKDVLGMDNDAMQSVFAKWNTDDLESYLIEITADILGFQENGEYVVDQILDKAGQKGSILSGPTAQQLPPEDWINPLGDALYAAKIVSYAQGYMLMQAAAEEFGWSLNYGGIAQMWRGGCIIRSAFLDNIKEAFDKDPNLANLLLDDFFRQRIENAQENWRKVLAVGITQGVSMPAMSAGLSFFDSYRRGVMPHNLLRGTTSHQLDRHRR